MAIRLTADLLVDDDSLGGDARLEIKRILELVREIDAEVERHLTTARAPDMDLGTPARTHDIIARVRPVRWSDRLIRR